jgi:hypothetical protein
LSVSRYEVINLLYFQARFASDFERTSAMLQEQTRQLKAQAMMRKILSA